jgi:CubicO group peptidase (beta-lactamase class C family)
MAPVLTHPNPDLDLGAAALPGWNQPANRRRSFHNLHQTVRYAQSFRAGRVMTLTKNMDVAIADRADVAALTALPWFSAMVVLRGSEVIFERYAPDFGPDRAHSIMSISKTMLNLMVGRLVADGKLDLSRTVDSYLPWIGAGYAKATLKQVLNMDVTNDYTEDYTDPSSRCFDHEAAIGYRLPQPGQPEATMKGFLASIGLAPGTSDCANRSGVAEYRSANTDVLACVVEAASGRSAASFYADIADAAGIEGVLNLACDRTGFPMADGGVCLTARDLARYGMIFARGGLGVNGETVGDAAFLATTRASGVPMSAPRQWLRYSNQTNTNGTWLGHGGYGGQYMLVNPETETVAVFFSVLENDAAYDPPYYVRIIRMFEDIACS